MPTALQQLARQVAPITQKTPAIPNPLVSAGVGVVQAINSDNSVDVLFNNSIVPVNPAGTLPKVGTTILIMTLGTQWWALGASLITGGGGGVETGFAPLDSPNFTGIPTAPTAPTGTDTIQLATTQFVQTAITAATGTTTVMTAGQEDTVRTESMSQLALPTSSVNMNTQALANVSVLTVYDGTPADGQAVFRTNPAQLGFYTQFGDAHATLAFGQLFGGGAIGFGGGPRINNPDGTTSSIAPDVYIYRSSPGSIICEGDFAHGKWTLATQPSAMALYRTTTDAQAYLSMGDLFGQSWLGMGAGGSSVPDVQLRRAPSGPCVAQWQLGNQTIGTGTMTWWDGVAGDGLVRLGLQFPRVEIFQNSTDTNSCLVFGAYGLGGAILMGQGGTGPLDVSLAHLGTATALWKLNQMNWWDGTAIDGEIRFNFDTVSHIASLVILKNYGDSQPVIGFGSTFGSGALELGSGGTAVPDVTLYRNGTGAAEWLMAGQMQWWDAVAGDPLTVLTTTQGLLTIYANNSDTQPAFQCGRFFTVPAIQFGPGGTTAPDITIDRSAAATLGITAPTIAITSTSLLSLGDGTTTHGQWLLSSSGVPLLRGYADSTHTNPVAVFGAPFSVPALQFGPGGVTAVDVTLSRSGTAAAQMNAASMTFLDGTTGHGSIVFTSNPYLLKVYASSTDTQPLIQLGSFGTTQFIQFGVGGSTVPDVNITRTGTQLATFTVKTLSITDGTTGDGAVIVAMSSTTPGVSVYANSSDTQPKATITGPSAGGLLSLGPGGSTTAPDVLLQRTGALAAQWTVSTVTTIDGTSSHGQITQTLAAAGQSTSYFGLTTDTNARLQVGVVLGAPFLQFGPGNAGADITLQRVAAGVLGMTTGSQAYSASTAQTIGTGTTITPNSTHVQITATGVTTNTAHPTITAGQNGQLVVVVNTGTNAITLTSNSSSAGTNLSLGAATRVLAAKGSITLIYNTALTEWVEIGFNPGGFG